MVLKYATKRCWRSKEGFRINNIFQYRMVSILKIMIIVILLATILIGYAFAENDIQWKYDNDKIWSNDTSHSWNGATSITSGVVECPNVRSISGVIPADGTLSFSWMKTIESDFSFIRNYDTSHEEFCRDYDNLGSFRNFSVNSGDIIEWKFKLPSPPCRSGQCWLIINYLEDETIPPCPEVQPEIVPPIEFDIISTPYICKGKNFHAYIIVESSIEIDGVSNLSIECTEGLNIINCLGIEGFFLGLNRGMDNLYESSISVPQRMGKLDLIYNVPSQVAKRKFQINISKIDLISGEKVIPLDPKTITIEVPDRFSNEIADDYRITYPDHRENIECLLDCVFDGSE